MKAAPGRQVLDYVVEHRDQLDMLGWGDPGAGGCGTTACLGGWTLILAGYRLEGMDRFIRPDGTLVPAGYIGHEAAAVLQLTDAEHYGLSSADCTVFGESDDDVAIARFRELVEAAERETS